MKLDLAREVEFSEYLSPIMLLNLTLAGVFYNVKRLSKMSVAVVLVQAVLGFLGPWIFRDEILAVGADENGNL